MIEIDSLARQILRVAPEFRGASFAPLGQGMDNRAVLVVDEFVFRFPWHFEAAERLRREIALLPDLAPRLALPIPGIEFVGEQTSTGYVFTGGPTYR